MEPNTINTAEASQENAGKVTAVTKKQKVLDYISANPKASVDEIAGVTGVNRQYIHTVVYLSKKAPKKTGAKRGRPRKDAAKATAPVASKKEDKSEEVIKSLLYAIQEQKVIIAYLESKLEGRRGASV